MTRPSVGSAPETGLLIAPGVSLAPGRRTALLLFMGVVVTLAKYQFLTLQQIDQLPALFRLLDPAYLQGDPFVDATRQFTEREGFIQFLAVLSAFGSLPVVYFALTALGNIGIGLVSFLAARDLFGRSEMAGVTAALVVLTGATFKLGYAPDLIRPTLIPSQLAMPLVMGAVWTGLRQRPVACAVLSSLVALIHPLVGPGVGGLLLLQQLLLRLHERDRAPRTYLTLLGAGVLVLAAAALHLAPYLAQSPGTVPDSSFWEVTFYRTPHHHVPSYFFRLREVILAAAFLSAAGLAGCWWYAQHPEARVVARGMLVLTGLIGLLCLGGYLFVEVWPVRLWLTLQTFRFLFVVKWLGLLLIGGMAGALWSSPSDRAWGLPLLLSGINPLTAVPVLGLHRWAPSGWRQRLERSTRGLPLRLLGLVAVLLGVVSGLDLIRDLPILPLLFAGLLIVIHRRRRFYGVMGVAAVAILLQMFVLPLLDLPSRIDRPIRYVFRPTWTFDSYPGYDFNLASLTPPGSVLLVPPSPEMGLIRLINRRALVVDVYAVPRLDVDMEAWRHRMLDVYSPLGTEHLTSLPEMQEAYEHLTEERLRDLGRRYGATHALLYRSTPVGLPVLARMDRLKLVALTDTSTVRP